MPARRKKKVRYFEPLGLRVDPVHLENRIFGWLAVISGAIGVALGVVTILGKFAEYTLSHFFTVDIPEYLKTFVIASVVVSFTISIVSGHLYSLHQLKFLHASVELLVKQIDLQKFFSFDSDEDQVSSVAIKKASVDYVRYISNLRHQVEHLDNADTLTTAGTILKDWSLIGIFVRQLINTLGEKDQLAVWMGISLVTNPEGWDAQNDVVYQFDNSISHALGEKILDRVYRVYYLEPGRQTAEELEAALQENFKRDDEKPFIPLTIRAARPNPRITGIQDVSFVWVNDDTSDYKRKNLPDPSWPIEKLRAEGWRIAVALEWVIRNNFLVDYVVIHSGSDGWVGEHHRKLAILWADAKELKSCGSQEK